MHDANNRQELSIWFVCYAPYIEWIKILAGIIWFVFNQYDSIDLSTFECAVCRITVFLVSRWMLIATRSVQISLEGTYKVGDINISFSGTLKQYYSHIFPGCGVLTVPLSTAPEYFGERWQLFLHTRCGTLLLPSFPYKTSIFFSSFFFLILFSNSFGIFHSSFVFWLQLKAFLVCRD